jgi:hypothetical protein
MTTISGYLDLSLPEVVERLSRSTGGGDREIEVDAPRWLTARAAVAPVRWHTDAGDGALSVRLVVVQTGPHPVTEAVVSLPSADPDTAHLVLDAVTDRLVTAA